MSCGTDISHAEKPEPNEVTPENAQERAARYGADEYGMRSYVMAFLYSGPNREGSAAYLDSIQREHLNNITRMASEGKLVLAGPFIDDQPLRGIYLFAVPTIEEAEALTLTDPAIKAGTLRMELRPWYGSAALLDVNGIHETLSQKGI